MHRELHLLLQLKQVPTDTRCRWLLKLAFPVPRVTVTVTVTSPYVPSHSFPLRPKGDLPAPLAAGVTGHTGPTDGPRPLSSPLELFERKPKHECGFSQLHGMCQFDQHALLTEMKLVIGNVACCSKENRGLRVHY